MGSAVERAVPTTYYIAWHYILFCYLFFTQILILYKMNRATKSGFAAEAQAKINSKYNEQSAVEVLEWIKAVTNEDINTSGTPDNLYETLKTGALLCRLINELKPGSIKKI